MKYTGPGPRAGPGPLGPLGRAPGARGEARAGGPNNLAGYQPRNRGPPARASPRAPGARPKGPKGPGPALGPGPVYFIK